VREQVEERKTPKNKKKERERERERDDVQQFSKF
jgi:hypothetical protein